MTIVADNEIYVLEDTPLVFNGETKYTVSKTTLKAYKATRGHSHVDQDEVYIFIEGVGVMDLDDKQVPVHEGSIIYVPSGVFHKVHNLSGYQLAFYAIFQGDSKRPQSSNNK